MADAPPARERSPAARISTAAVQLLREYTGRGPTKAKTTIADDLVVIIFSETLLKAERTLIERGRSDTVSQLRHEFQSAMRDDLCAAVEEALGRKVIAFMSANHTEPDMAAEIFVLAPGGDGRGLQVVDGAQ